ncbi:hypothetical protein [Neobacillus sp. SAB-20_R2A]|uniref:hypothetical protein n=1 Tax=Neobacillus sp. SAB-20_R2A TaxID=3120519 RepID=UPI003C6E36A8
MKNKTNDIECLVCNGIHFRKGYIAVKYERYHENYKINETADADLKFLLESEEEHPLKNIPEQSNLFTYICEDCGFIMNFIQEKQVESKKKERLRKQRQKMYDWTKFK